MLIAANTSLARAWMVLIWLYHEVPVRY